MDKQNRVSRSPERSGITEDEKMRKIKLSARAKKLLKKCISGQLLDAFECGEFCEFVIRVAGDVLTFRVYDDGSVCER